jgi:5'-deoxynucleotidase YfbR-like HD superfamily hydrolase
MDAATIITKIDTVYERFLVPPHIQNHMRRVAGVTTYILDRWNGPTVNDELVTAAALVHDLGNIAKIEFDTELDAALLKGENTERWRRAKKTIKTKYGDEAKTITLAMLRELDVDERLHHIIRYAEFEYACRIRDGTDWELKLLKYGDIRVAPHGVTSVKERLNEAAERYEHDKHPDTPQLTQCCYDIEDQIMTHTDAQPQDITDDTITPQNL